MTITRRRLGATLAAGLLLAACSGLDGGADGIMEREREADGDSSQDADSDSSQDADSDVGQLADPEPGLDEESETAADEDAPGPPPPPEAPAPVSLSDAEVLPNGKRLASDVVQAVTTYDPEDTLRGIADDVAAAEDAVVDADELASSIEPLYHDDAWSRGEIVYPQLGGATTTDASVMVVVRQTTGHPDGSQREVTRTIDVRLTLVGDAWAFAGIEDAGGEPVPRPDELAPEAAAVLDDDRIELPDSAIWDIHAGRTETQLLEVMSDLAERHRYGVVVLERGHPIHIFDTDRISTHLYGIAVDVYHLDGELIVDGREDGSPVHETTRWLHEHEEVTNLGSPWALDGFGGRSFTDLVHQDHLHIEAGTRPDGPPPHREDLAEDTEPPAE